MPPLPLPLRPENLRLFFTGVRATDTCCASGRRARRWRDFGTEWVRPLIERSAWAATWAEDGPPAKRWAIDFPPGADERALAAAGELGRIFHRSGKRIVRHGPAAELRIALAKCDRYLASPAGGWRARWRWVPADRLPGSGLVVAVRDDDYLAGLLASRWLEVWLRGTHRRLGAQALRCFPLPWAPDTPRSALSRLQEEHRTAVIQAWRAAGGGTSEMADNSAAAPDLDSAVATAYAWPAGIGPDEALRRLLVKARTEPAGTG